MATTRAKVIREQAGGHGWEMAFRPPPACVQPYVRQYCGYSEKAPGALRRHEFPIPQVVVIFEFGPTLRLIDALDPSRVDRFPGGFAAGLGSNTTITEHDGFQAGMEVMFTPIGARLFFGIPMSALAERLVGLRDMLPASARDISDRLGDARDWDARFDLLDDFIASRIASARASTELTGWAVDRIEQTGGQLDIRALARELGYSQKHLISLFRDQVGVPPKLVARLFRFDRVIQHMRSGSSATWAQIAAACGFYDQAHLNREMRLFTGTTPTATRAMITGAPAPPGA